MDAIFWVGAIWCVIIGLSDRSKAVCIEITQDGMLVGYGIQCPGCGSVHSLDQRWSYNGDPVRPTFTPSILAQGSRGRCHSFVRDGLIEFLDDCDHGLAGKTVPLKPW